MESLGPVKTPPNTDLKLFYGEQYCHFFESGDTYSENPTKQM